MRPYGLSVRDGETRPDCHLDFHSALKELKLLVLLYVHRNRWLIRDGEGGGGRLYTYRHTVTTRMFPALRWAAMRAILMFQ